MENGVGVSLKVSNTPEEEEEVPNDEVFEEAVEFGQDDGNGFKFDSLHHDDGNGFKFDSLDDAVFSDANGEVASGFSSGLGDHEETIEQAFQETNGGESESESESERIDKKDVSLVSDDKQGVVDHPSNGHDSVVADVEEIADDQQAMEAELVVDEETKLPTVEKPVNEETLDNRDVHSKEGVDSGTSFSVALEDSTSNEDVNHVSERLREHEDSSHGISSEDQLEKHVQDYGSTQVEGTLGSANLELQGSNVVVPGGSEIVEDDQTTSPAGYKVGDSRDEETNASGDNATKAAQLTPLPTSSAEKDIKNVTVVTSDSETKTVSSDSAASDSETKNGDSTEPKSPGLAVVDRQASAEIAKPAESAVRSSEKSANAGVPPMRPAGLGSAAPLLELSSRAANQPRANGQQSQGQSNAAEDANDGEVEEGDEVRQKLQMIRVKFLRLAHRLGQTPHNVVVAQVLYRLGLAEQLRARSGGRYGAFSFDRASAMAEQLEATGQEPLDFSCTIMVIGKTGVGKSATINSIFDEVKFNTNAFQMGTKKVQDIIGTVQGIKVRVIDTPGLLSSSADQRQNERILNSVKRFIKTSPPDIVLYLDRLDMPSRDFADMPLLRTITEIFGPSIWFNAIVVLTHAASAPPEGPNGTASTYDMFVTQRSHAVQQAIRQAAGDMRLMNPVSLVENHSACRTNRAGQRVLPSGQVWKPHLLLLSFASKILAEANTLLKLQDTPSGKNFTPRSRPPPLPFLLSSLLQSKPQLKLPEEQFADDDAIDDELDDSSESDDESEYDELPPFKPLTKAQLAKLSKAQKKAYYDEIEYREKLLMKKQMKEDKRRRKLMKQMAATAQEMLGGEYTENVEEESGEAASSVPVPMPDLSLPASFDSDNPTHRYRHLDTSNQWLVRPVLDNHGWDHDVGYEGINVEKMFVVKDKIPLSFSGQVSKDKKESNVQMEVASSIKHGEGKATTLGFDMQSVGKDMAYTLRSESRFSNYRHNKVTAGLSATVLGDSVSAGLKLEDKLIVNKQFKVVVSGGAMASRGDVAYGGSLEATLRDKDFPLGRFLSTLGLSVMDWHGELALGCNIQTQIPVGRSTNLIARANLNNRGSGQVSLRLNSSEQVQLALIGLLPLIRRLVGEYRGNSFGL